MLNSRSLDDLIPEVREPMIAVLADCEASGMDMLTASTLRDLQAQAALYRKNRTRAAILAKMERMTKAGFGFLAEIIENVGPQEGNGGGVVTYAGPGESWHNYGRAADNYPLVHGKLATDRDQALWTRYGASVVRHGLEWAGNWTGFRELPHAQLGVGGNPLRTLPREEIMRLLSPWLSR